MNALFPFVTLVVSVFCPLDSQSHTFSLGAHICYGDFHRHAPSAQTPLLTRLYVQLPTDHLTTDVPHPADPDSEPSLPVFSTMTNVSSSLSSPSISNVISSFNAAQICFVFSILV